MLAGEGAALSGAGFSWPTVKASSSMSDSPPHDIVSSSLSISDDDKVASIAGLGLGLLFLGFRLLGGVDLLGRSLNRLASALHGLQSIRKMRDYAILEQMNLQRHVGGFCPWPCW